MSLKHPRSVPWLFLVKKLDHHRGPNPRHNHYLLSDLISWVVLLTRCSTYVNKLCYEFCITPVLAGHRLSKQNLWSFFEKFVMILLNFWSYCTVQTLPVSKNIRSALVRRRYLIGTFSSHFFFRAFLNVLAEYFMIIFVEIW